MVVDRARRENAGVEKRGCADDEEREHRHFPAHQTADAQEQIEGERIEREGPGDQNGGFAGSLRAGDCREKQNDRGDRGVDQPRPVHQKPTAGTHAVLMQVEPALPGDQVAYLDQAQQAVIVGGSGEVLEAAGGGYSCDDQRCGKRHGRIAAPPRSRPEPWSGHGHLARHLPIPPRFLKESARQDRS